MSGILDRIVVQKRSELASRMAATPLTKMQNLIRKAPPVRDFAEAIKTCPGVSLIAEVKKASPSCGVIREDFDPVAIAVDYEAAGATCVSVLTDEQFFQGSLDYLPQIRAAVELPALRKDFIIDEYQVYESRAAGADAVLLIAECLTENQLRFLYESITSLGMTALVEFHEAENLEVAVGCGANLIGINNRDLKKFETDLNHCLRLREQIPPDRTVVAESGICSREDVERLAESGIDGMLVGESLMRQADLRAAVRSLLGR